MEELPQKRNNNIVTMFVIVTVIFMLLAGVIALMNQNQVNSQEKLVQAYHDRSDSQLEVVYCIQRREAFIQVANFPGYSDRRWYYWIEMPNDAFDIIIMLSQAPASLKPPFPPGAGQFARVTISLTSDCVRSTEFFSDGNPDTAASFSQLRRLLIDEKHRVNKLPTWFEQNRTALRQINWQS